MKESPELLNETEPSRSQRKRDAEAVRELAAQLVGLSATQLDQVGLDETLREEVTRVQAIAKRGARKRELGHLAKLMRRWEPAELAALQATLATRRAPGAAATAAHQRAERLREQLLDDEHDAALGSLLDEHPTLDRQHLRSLVRQARRERVGDKPPHAARALFRLLRQLPDR